MACRAPVVASAVGGIQEVVVPPSGFTLPDGSAPPSGQEDAEETGFLVPFVPDPATTFPSDPAQFARDLAAPITALLADPARAKAMGEAGRRRVEAKFSWEAIATQTINLYQSLLKTTP
jgi:starch synthase